MLELVFGLVDLCDLGLGLVELGVTCWAEWDGVLPRESLEKPIPREPIYPDPAPDQSIATR